MGALGTALKILPTVVTVAAKAPAVIGLASDMLKGAKSVAKNEPEAKSGGFAEAALAILAFAATQFETSDKAREYGCKHGTTITVTMNRKVPGWELAEDHGLIPYLEGLIQGAKSDG